MVYIKFKEVKSLIVSFDRSFAPKTARDWTAKGLRQEHKDWIVVRKRGETELKLKPLPGKKLLFKVIPVCFTHIQSDPRVLLITPARNKGSVVIAGHTFRAGVIKTDVVQVEDI